MLGFERFLGDAERLLFAGELLALVRKIRQLALDQRQLAVEGCGAIGNLLQAAGQLHLLRVRLVNLRSQRVLFFFQSAGGGVGLAALDIAKKIGATTYGTASPSKHEFLRKRGLDHPIDYRTQDWLPILLQLTDGRGVELVIDPIGGTHWKKSFKALRHTGRLGMFGVSTASANGLSGKLKMVKAALQMPRFHPLGLLNKNRGVFGLNLGHMWHEPDKVMEWIEALLAGVNEGWIRPHVDRTFTFAQAGEAHAYMEARKNIGKVILVP